MPWYANQQIRQGNTLAYDVGHTVPASNVDRHGYDRDGLVDWVEPGEHYQAEPVPSPQLGVFLNAPVQPDAEPAAEPAPASGAPVEEGTRALADGGAVQPTPGGMPLVVPTGEPVKPAAKAKSKTSDTPTEA